MVIDLGRKGAAFANLGDIAAGFLPEPFAESREGVKLGESTFSPLLKLLLKSEEVSLRREENWVGLPTCP